MFFLRKMDYKPLAYSIKKDKIKNIKEFILKYDKQFIGMAVILVLFIMYKIYTYFKGTEEKNKSKIEVAEAEKKKKEAESLANELALKLSEAEAATASAKATAEAAIIVAEQLSAEAEANPSDQDLAQKAEDAEQTASLAQEVVLKLEEAETVVAEEAAVAAIAAVEASESEVSSDSYCSTFKLCEDECPGAMTFGYEACRYCCSEEEFCIVNKDSAWCTEQTVEAEEDLTPEQICAQYNQANGCPAELGCRSARNCPPNSSDQHTCDYYVSLGDGPDGPNADPTYESVKNTLGCDCACEPIPEIVSELTPDEQAEIDYCNETNQADSGGCKSGCRPARDCGGETCEDWVIDSEGTRDYKLLMGDRYNCACGCEPTVEGCTNSSADNYNPHANSTQEESEKICITCSDTHDETECNSISICEWNNFSCEKI